MNMTLIRTSTKVVMIRNGSTLINILMFFTFIYLNIFIILLLNHNHRFVIGCGKGIGVGNADVSPINMGRISPSFCVSLNKKK